MGTEFGNFARRFLTDVNRDRDHARKSANKNEGNQPGKVCVRCAAHGKTTADRRFGSLACKNIFVTHAIMMRMKMNT